MSFQYAWGGPNEPVIHEAISRWVSNQSFGVDDNVWQDSTSYGVINGGKPVAGIVFHDWKPSAGTIQYSGAAIDRNWLRGPFLHNMFSYMFDDLGCQMVITGNSSENTGLHRILARLGHEKNVIKRGWGRHVDLYLWTLTREQWVENDIMQRSRGWAKENPHVEGT